MKILRLILALVLALILFPAFLIFFTIAAIDKWLRETADPWPD